MAIPPNITDATAIELDPLPFAAVVAAYDAGTSTTYPLWYKHTCTETRELSLFAYGVIGGNPLTEYLPYPQVWTGSPGSLTQYLTFTGLNSENKAIQVPVFEGTTYYFEYSFTAPLLGVNPSTFTFAAELHSPQDVPFGSIIVNDDTPGFPAVALDAISGEALRFFPDIPAGEAADVLTNGLIAFGDVDTSDVLIYSPDLSEILTTVTASVDASHGGNIRTCLGTGRWWVLEDLGATTQARSLDSDGTLGDVYALTGSSRVDCLAANNDETILYYARSITLERQIRRWDLVNDVALADFKAEVTDYFTWDILILADGSILISYIDTGAPDFYVKRFDAAGTTLNTYEFGSDLRFPNDAPPRLAYGTDGLTFWVWFKPTGADEGKGRFQCVTVADGTIVSTTDSREYEFGVYEGDQTATPDKLFGNSASCPFFLLRTEISSEPPDPQLNGPPGLEQLENDGILRVIPTVRQRRTPHTADEQQRIFQNYLQLDMQPGVGLGDGQGEDPKVEYRWSDDGGFTWSNGRTLTLGRQGQYKHRAMTWQCGAFRDRVHEFTMSDPVPTVWIDVYIGITDSDETP